MYIFAPCRDERNANTLTPGKLDYGINVRPIRLIGFRNIVIDKSQVAVAVRIVNTNLGKTDGEDYVEAF